MALKHKGLEFESLPWRFTEKDRIEFTGSATVPVIVDGKRAVYDSFEIAVYLDEAYPNRPGLFEGMESRALSLFLHHWALRSLHPPLLRAILLDLYRHLHEKDKAYFRESREKRLGGGLAGNGGDPQEWVPRGRRGPPAPRARGGAGGKRGRPQEVARRFPRRTRAAAAGAGAEPVRRRKRAGLRRLHRV